MFELTSRPPIVRASTKLYVKPHIFSGQVQRLVIRPPRRIDITIIAIPIIIVTPENLKITEL